MEELRMKLMDIAKEMRIDSLNMSFYAGNTGAHLGGGLSMIEIMAVLYCEVINISSENPFDESRDRVILSKGHGVLAYYAALLQKGFLTREDLSTFKADETFLTGHPSMDYTHGIELSSGSLGQGLSVGVGCALALKRKKNEGSRVFVILGDGECNEGSIWEAAMSASHFELDNLNVVIDKNGLQYDGSTENVMNMNSMKEKWEAFGFETYEVDGHDVVQLVDVFSKKSINKPTAIIANTVKGKGISFMENSPKWHHAVLNKNQLDEAMKELGA